MSLWYIEYFDTEDAKVHVLKTDCRNFFNTVDYACELLDPIRQFIISIIWEHYGEMVSTSEDKLFVSDVKKELDNFDVTQYAISVGVVPESDWPLIEQEIRVVRDAIIEASVKHALVIDYIPLVKYSMVLIDSINKNLDWRKAKEELGIEKLLDEHYDV